MNTCNRNMSKVTWFSALHYTVMFLLIILSVTYNIYSEYCFFDGFDVHGNPLHATPPPPPPKKNKSLYCCSCSVKLRSVLHLEQFLEKTCTERKWSYFHDLLTWCTRSCGFYSDKTVC